MNAIVGAARAVYNFVVGDMRLLVGTLLALIVAGLLARAAPAAAGAALLLLLIVTLVVSLQRELPSP